MTLAEWFEEQDKLRPGGKGALSECMWKTQVSLPTLFRAKLGKPVSRRIAITLSQYTGNAVSVDELMKGATGVEPDAVDSADDEPEVAEVAQ